jgi:hypothetical protein
LRVGGVGLLVGTVRLGLAGLALRRLDDGHTRQRIVGDELVACGGQRPADRTGDADADDITAEPLAALCQGDVVGITGDDDDVGEVGQPEHVLDGVDRQPDVGPVLGVGRRGKELHQVDRSADELTLVFGVDVGRPVRVGPRQHQGAEGRREVDDRADVDSRLGQASRLLVKAGGSVSLKRAATVDLVVPRDDDVVEIEIDGHARGAGFSHTSVLSPVG